MTRDPSLYRPGVGLILTDGAGHVWLGERRGWTDSWQLPQGGIEPGEEIEDAMWRELAEEVGTASAELLGATEDWTFYEFPRGERDGWIGQRHRWFVLRFVGDESELDPTATDVPEFDSWRWATPEEVLTTAVEFKRPIYETAFAELRALLTR